MAFETVNPRSPLQFQFTIAKLPAVSFWCQTVNIPSIQGTVIEQPTPFVNAKVALSRLSVGPLSITFLVDEQLQNYTELYNWLRGLTNPTGFDDYADYAAQHDLAYAHQDIMTSEATLLLNDSNNQLIRRITFPNIVPVALGGMTFETTDTGVSHITCTAGFAATFFDVGDIVTR